jgi:hypothetical protein
MVDLLRHEKFFWLLLCCFELSNKARREFIDLCEDSDEPKVVRTIDMEAEKPADTGFRSLLSKSAFHPRDASAGNSL